MGAFKPFDPPRNKRGPHTYYCETCHMQITQRLVKRDGRGPYHVAYGGVSAATHQQQFGRHELLVIPTHPSEV